MKREKEKIVGELKYVLYSYDSLPNCAASIRQYDVKPYKPDEHQPYGWCHGLMSECNYTTVEEAEQAFALKGE